MSSCSKLQDALRRLRKRRHCYTLFKYTSGIFYVLLLCITVVGNTVAATLTGIFSATSADSSNDAGSGSSNQTSLSGGFIAILVLNCFSAVTTVVMPFVCWCAKMHYDKEKETYDEIQKISATHKETVDLPDPPMDDPLPEINSQGSEKEEEV